MGTIDSITNCDRDAVCARWSHQIITRGELSAELDRLHADLALLRAELAIEIRTARVVVAADDTSTLIEPGRVSIEHRYIDAEDSGSAIRMQACSGAANIMVQALFHDAGMDDRRADVTIYAGGECEPAEAYVEVNCANETAELRRFLAE